MTTLIFKFDFYFLLLFLQNVENSWSQLGVKYSIYMSDNESRWIFFIQTQTINMYYNISMQSSLDDWIRIFITKYPCSAPAMISYEFFNNKQQVSMEFTEEAWRRRRIKLYLVQIQFFFPNFFCSLNVHEWIAVLAKVKFLSESESGHEVKFFPANIWIFKFRFS